MCGGFLNIFAPGLLALCQNRDRENLKLKCETDKAEDLMDLRMLKLQLENLFGKSTLDL